MPDNKHLEANTIETSIRESSSASFEEGMVFQDERGYVRAVNPSAANILGLSAEQLMGRTSLDASWQTIHEDGSPFEGETHPAMVALSTGKPCTNVVMGIYRPSGELVWLKIDSQPLFQDSQTKPYGVVTKFSEITERQATLRDRKQTEEDLTPIQQDLLLPVSRSDDGFWNWNVLSKKVGFSSRWKQMRGYQDHEIKDSEEEWSNNIHPEDCDRVRAAIEAHFTKKTPYFREEYRVRRKDGSYIWILARGQAFWHKNGNVVQMVGSETDITERKRIEQALELSERRYSSLAQLAPVGIFGTDRDGNCIYVNDRCCEIMGLSTEKSLGEGWANALHPDDRDRQTSKWIQAVEKNVPFYSECRFQHNDGTVRWTIAQAIAETDDEGRVIGYIGTLTDITDRKQAEIALRESERSYRTVFETINDGFCVCEMLFDENGTPNDYRFLEVNPIFEQMTGLESAAGKTARELVPNLENFWFEIYGRVALTGEPVRFENQSIPMNRWFEVKAFPVGEPQSHKFGIVFTNITDRKQAEKALQESEERLRLSLWGAGQGIWDWNLKTEILTWDERCKEIFGLSPDSPVSYEWHINALHPDDRERLITSTALALSEHRELEEEYRTICPDGTTRWVLARGRGYYDSAGNPYRMSGTVLDISDRQQAEKALHESEEHFRTLADNISQFAWMADENGWIFWYNQRWFEYTGTNLEEMQGWGWQKVHHPDYVERVVEHISHCFKTGELWEDTFPLKGKDGTYRWFLSRALPIKDEAGLILRWFGTNTDIDDRVQFEGEREQLLKREQAAREEAEAVNRIKDEFLAILSHELRSPLNPILGWTQLLTTYKLDSERLDQGLETIDRNAKLLLELIDDLLDVAKILRGKITLNLAPVDLVRALEGALETVSAAANAKSIAIETYLSPIGQVNGDLARLQQIFWNLLSNAVKFTNNGGKVEVRVDRFADTAQITVSDNGKGIVPEFLPHVFEYFRQADSSVTRKHGGLGLGLAIVRHLVELHGGVIAVTSSGIGCGATFIVSLPLFKTNSDSDNSDRSKFELSSSQPDLTGVRILVVDDDPDNLEFLTMALQHYQASVVASSSAQEALAIFEEFAPDVLVSDIAMPSMDGLTLLRAIRARSPEQGGEIPAIALTAYARELDREQAITAGFQVHIPKPVNITFLAATILELFSEAPIN